MNGNNASFTADPLGFINRSTVNNVSAFGYGMSRADQLRFEATKLAKEGAFDFNGALGAAEVEFRLSGNVAGGEHPVRAYWIPFEQGVGLPGYVDLPRDNPPLRFAFTASMNGCALVATESPIAGHLRIYHHQHPDQGEPGSDEVWRLIHGQRQPIMSIMGFEDYAQGGNAAGAPNAFNFLYYRKRTGRSARWVFVVQPQWQDMVSHVCRRNVAMACREIDVY